LFKSEQRLGSPSLTPDIPALLSAARKFPLAGVKAEARDRKLGYFENNAHRMRYARFRSLGMFIGSGAVEAGCKAAPGAAPEAVWHEMVPGRGDRDPHPALPGSQRSLGRDLAAAAQPSRSGLTPHLTTARTQTIKVSPGYPRVTYKLVSPESWHGCREW